MLAPAAIGHHTEGDALGDLGGRQARDHLELHKLVQQIAPRRHITRAQIGRDGLGEAADVDHAAELVQAGQRGAHSRIHVGVDVVLHQRKTMLLGQLQQPVQVRDRRHGTGRALQARLGEEHRGPVCGQQRLQRGQVIARGGARHAHHLRARKTQHEVQIGVAGVVHQNHITGLDQAASHQVQRLAGALGQQHLVGIHRQVVLGQRLGHHHAQRHVAVGQAVAVQLGPIGRQLAHAALDRIAK